MNKKCGVCSRLVKPGGGTACSSCGIAFHVVCGVPQEIVDILSKGVDLSWFCNTCKENNYPKNLHETFTAFASKISKDISKLSTKLGNDIAGCKKEIDEHKNDVAKELKRCSNSHYMSQLRANRFDIIFTGVPEEMRKKPKDLIRNICSLFNVPYSEQIITTAITLKNRKNSLLVKFQNTFDRDMLMKEYFNRNATLKLSEIMNTEIESRIYLEDNLPLEMSLMKMHSQRAKKGNVIQSFKVFPSKCLIECIRTDGSTTSFHSLDELKKELPLVENAATGGHNRR